LSESKQNKYAIKSYVLEIDGKQIREEMYPINTIIRALQFYEEKYNGIVGAIEGSKTVKEIVDEMIKSNDFNNHNKLDESKIRCGKGKNDLIDKNNYKVR